MTAPRANYGQLIHAGCEEASQSGHEIWFSPITGRNFVVDGKILSRHTANAILKQAGIAYKF